MVVDDSDRVWVVETGVQPNRFVGFDPMSGEFFSNVPVESGGGTVRHMYFDAKTNSVWFGADTNTVGVAKLPPRRRVVSD
jgi:virginiamycin B lyase